MEVTADRKYDVAFFLMERIPGYKPSEFFQAIGVLDEGCMVGGVIYDNFRGTSIEMSAAGDGAWLSRPVLRSLFAYPFIQLGCRRVTAICADGNKNARLFVHRIGFTREGRLRSAMDTGEDAIVFGMLREECKWLKGK